MDCKIWGTSRLRAYFSDGSADRVYAYLTPADSLASNAWYFLLFTFDRDETMKAYVNGKILAGSSYLNISAQQGDVANIVSIKIGAYSSASGRLAGQMDEVMIFHAIPTQAEINNLYLSGLKSLLSSGNISEEEYSNRVSQVNNY